jgi:hypothetical protein
MINREAPARSRDGNVAVPRRERQTVRSTYQRLRMVGLSAAEAGNLTAHLNGLRVAEQGWALPEIERLLFIRALVDLGRIES